MGLESSPSRSLFLVSIPEEIPGVETSKVLDTAVGLKAGNTVEREVTGAESNLELTLSLPTVVAVYLRVWETVG